MTIIQLALQKYKKEFQNRRSSLLFEDRTNYFNYFNWALFLGDYKVTHFLWVMQTSKPFLFQFYVKLCRCAITCETL